MLTRGDLATWGGGCKTHNQVTSWYTGLRKNISNKYIWITGIWAGKPTGMGKHGRTKEMLEVETPWWISFRISPFWHNCWGLDPSLWDGVLSTVGCWSACLVSTQQMPVGFPVVPFKKTSVGVAPPTHTPSSGRGGHSHSCWGWLLMCERRWLKRRVGSVSGLYDTWCHLEVLCRAQEGSPSDGVLGSLMQVLWAPHTTDVVLPLETKIERPWFLVLFSVFLRISGGAGWRQWWLHALSCVLSRFLSLGTLPHRHFCFILPVGRARISSLLLFLIMPPAWDLCALWLSCFEESTGRWGDSQHRTSDSWYKPLGLILQDVLAPSLCVFWRRHWGTNLTFIFVPLAARSAGPGLTSSGGRGRSWWKKPRGERKPRAWRKQKNEGKVRDALGGRGWASAKFEDADGWTGDYNPVITCDRGLSRVYMWPPEHLASSLPTNFGL